MVTALYELPERKSNHVMWQCKCDCGTIFIARGASLKAGNTKSCGCLTRSVKEGDRYGRLVVLERVGIYGGAMPEWSCKCDCGVISIVVTGNLTSGNTRSCGCLLSNYDMTVKDKISRHKFSHTDITYDNWRKRVFEKDGYCCQCCGNFGVDLDAHHLDGWDWCQEKRLDVSNGISLCRYDCHKDFHSKYGRGKNTRFQYYEYYENRKREINIGNLFDDQP